MYEILARVGKYDSSGPKVSFIQCLRAIGTGWFNIKLVYSLERMTCRFPLKIVKLYGTGGNNSFDVIPDVQGRRSNQCHRAMARVDFFALKPRFSYETGANFFHF